MGQKYEINPDHPEVFAAPSIPAGFERRLVAEFGQNPYGEALLRPEWGGTTRHFACGRPDRIKYVAMSSFETYLVHGVYDPTCRGCGRADQTRKKESDAERLQCLACGTIQPAIDPATLTENIKTLPQVLKPGQFYAQQKLQREEFYGPPLWFIAQWQPASHWGTPEVWESHRYTLFKEPAPERTYVPATGTWKEDTLGPYPEMGKYIEVMIVENAEGDPFRDLDETVITELHARRRALEADLRSAEQKAVDEHYEQAQAYEREEEEIRARAYDFFKPHIHRIDDTTARIGYRKGRFEDALDNLSKIKATPLSAGKEAAAATGSGAA